MVSPTWITTTSPSARAGNAIGGGDWATDRIVPDSMRALKDGRAVRVRHPSAVRPWQHVLEPLSGYLALGARLLSDRAPSFCEAWNFGPDPASHRKVRELVESLIARWGSGSWDESTDEAPHEVSLLRLAADKSRAKLDWRPRWSFERAVEATVDWYRDYYAGRDMKRACEEQVAAYMEES